MEERPTRRVYIEILTCVPSFLGLEEFRSNTSEREVERAHGQGARPSQEANQAPSRGLCSTASKD